jgi:hypothetical protein
MSESKDIEGAPSAFSLPVPQPLGRLQGHDTLFGDDLNVLRSNASLSPFEYWNAWRPIYQDIDSKRETTTYVILHDVRFSWRSFLGRTTAGLPPRIYVNVYNFETVMILHTMAVSKWNTVMETGLFLGDATKVQESMERIKYAAVVFKAIASNFLVTWVKPLGTILPPEVDIGVVTSLRDLCIALVFVMAAYAAGAISSNSAPTKRAAGALIACRQFRGGYERLGAVLELLRTSESAQANLLSKELVQFVFDTHLYCFKGFVGYIIETVENLNDDGQNYGEVIYHLKTIENKLKATASVSTKDTTATSSETTTVPNSVASSSSDIHTPCLSWLRSQIELYESFNSSTGKPPKNINKWEIPLPGTFNDSSIPFPLDIDVTEDTQLSAKK